MKATLLVLSLAETFKSMGSQTLVRRSVGFRSCPSGFHMLQTKATAAGPAPARSREVHLAFSDLLFCGCSYKFWFQQQSSDPLPLHVLRSVRATVFAVILTAAGFAAACSPGKLPLWSFATAAGPSYKYCHTPAFSRRQIFLLSFRLYFASEHSQFDVSNSALRAKNTPTGFRWFKLGYSTRKCLTHHFERSFIKQSTCSLKWPESFGTHDFPFDPPHFRQLKRPKHQSQDSSWRMLPLVPWG